ncbi:Hypothetical Protein FCC1311_059852 [Hondaea fermentalgiana]|uniref:EF-hand domain-containing protein n=1 Tax=Hondaea fermentalgiana TaxID=2315210 RepID=A0A2R5GPG4_9STRA|nr:Hypothetical Protein FCC1311_059852 [Hondaea fermentalgiana]|eukprot:GBG29764.1 Hypothetical Protein FCC1311_059852 [Hondaea fermentalgiana]
MEKDPKDRAAASRAWLEKLAQDVREAGAGFCEAELRDAFQATLGKQPYWDEGVQIVSADSGADHRDLPHHRGELHKITERFLRIVTAWRGRITIEDERHLQNAAALLIKVYGAELYTFAGASACFARGSLELEAAADVLQRKLKVLADLDGGTDKTFARWTNKAKKQSHAIDVNGFRRLFHQLLRGRDSAFCAREIEKVIMRFLDPAGFDEIDKEALEKFIYSRVPRFCEHAAWITNASMNEDPRVLVDVRVLSTRATKMQQLELVDQGFEHAMGRNVGIWIKRAARSEYADKDAFQRARVTGIICQWTRTKDPAAEEALTRHGFVVATEVPTRSTILNHFLTRTSTQPRVWIRRNAKAPRALCNLYVGRLDEMPPCRDLQRLDTSPDLRALQNRAAALSATLAHELVLFGRLIRSDGDSVKRDLEVEFAKIASGLGASEREHAERRDARARALRIEKVRKDLVDQLVSNMLDVLTSPEECLSRQVPDTELLIECARDALDLAQTQLEHSGQRPSKKNNPVVQPGHLTRRKACEVLDGAGLTVDSAKSLKELLSALASTTPGTKKLVSMRALRELFRFNPARVQQLLVEACRIHGQRVLGYLGSHETISEVSLREALAPALLLTSYEFREWELNHVVHAFGHEHRTGHVELGKLRESVASILTALEREAPETNQAIDNKSIKTLQDFIVDSFGNESSYEARFAELSGRDPDTNARISLARLKSIVRRRTFASDEQISAFWGEHGIQAEGFVDAKELHRIACTLVARESPRLDRAKTLEEEVDAGDFDVELNSDSDDNEAHGKETQRASLFGGPEGQTMLDWAALRESLCRTDAYSLKAMLKAKQALSEVELRAMLSKTEAILSQGQFQSLVDLAKTDNGVAGKSILCSAKLLRALWPAQDLAPDAECRPRELLEAARLTIQKSLRGGLGAKRLMQDVLLYDAGEPEHFTCDHLAKLVKRLVPKSGLKAADRAHDGIMLARTLQRKVRGEHVASAHGEILFAELWTFLVDETVDKSGRQRMETSAYSAHLRDFVEVENPAETFQRLDEDGNGTISQTAFGEAMRAVAPQLPQPWLASLRNEFRTTSNRVRYDGALMQRLQLRPRKELDAMLQIISDLRCKAQQRVNAPSGIHLVELLHSRDDSSSGYLTRESFRDVLEDDLGANTVLNETQMQMLLRWVQSAHSPSLVDYGRFVRMMAPSYRQVNGVLTRLKDHLKLSSEVAGGELDMRAAFGRVDAMGTGHISRRDFVATLEKSLGLYPQPLSLRDVQVLLDDLDPSGHDMVDYVRFCAQCLGMDGEKGALVQSIGEKVRAALLRSRIDPNRVFARNDPTESGCLDFEDFFDACEDLYIPCSRTELLLLVQHFDWLEATKSSRLVHYTRFVSDLIRAGGPGGIFSRAARAPPGTAPVRGGDTVWNSSSVQQWLASGSTSSEAKAKFVQVFRSVQRAREHAEGGRSPLRARQDSGVDIAI